MKSRINLAAIALLFLAVSLVPTVSAQQDPGIRKASIPFAFYVDDRRFPAGDYEIRWVGTHMLIRGAHGREQAFLSANRVETGKANQRNVLSFNMYGGHVYYLSQIWVAGNDFGEELRKSGGEVEISRKSATSSYAMVGLRPSH